MSATENPVHLLYLAIGSSDLQVQASYAAYSALAYQGALNLSVHVYSDAPAAFEPLEHAITVHPVSERQVSEWKGPGDYPYRMKIAALAEMTKDYADSPVLFVDSDTFFFGSAEKVLARVGNGRAVLHRNEYPVLTHPTGQLEKFRRRMGKFRFRGSPVDLDADMWNSGAIGLHPSQFHLLNTILAFIDTISPKYKKQLVEQYAVSYFLQKNAAIQACDDCVVHYWNQKPEYQAAIEPRLAKWKKLPLATVLEELRSNPIVLPSFQETHGLVRRISDRLTGET
jgi:hypothetical protein